MNIKRNLSMIFATILSLLIVWSAIPAHAEPAMWVVKGPHSTVYLFGTVHVLQKEKPWRTTRIDDAIRNSDSLWLEVTNADDAAAMLICWRKLRLRGFMSVPGDYTHAEQSR